MNINQSSNFKAEQEDWARRPLREFGPMMALAVLLPIHFFFLRKITLGVLYWALVCFAWTLFALIPIGLWWFINLFLVKGCVTEYNSQVMRARNALR